MSTYNLRLYDYPTGLHVTAYQRPIVKSGSVKNKNFNKGNKNENRTEEQEEHCIRQSLNVTKNKIYHLARSNKWELFITLTFNRNKKDSSDYDLVVKTLTTFLNNLRKRKCPDLIYLIVPELHKDMEHYHFHGLLANLKNMRLCPSGTYTKDRETVYHVLDWKFGYTTATKVVDTARASSYLTKYITKQACVFLRNKKRYYASRNIERAEAEYYNTPDDVTELLKTYGADLTYIKSQTIAVAHQRVTYMEISQ